MIQSHVLQFTSLVAMEAPARSSTPLPCATKKSKSCNPCVLSPPKRSGRTSCAANTVPAKVNGKAVPGYRQEPGVKPDSSTDTFAALKLHVDNWRWSGVPFYLRSGKRLALPHTEVAILFKRAPHMVFRGENTETNSLVLNIQPEEGISLSFGAKTPGSQMHIRPVKMDFEYKNTFGASSRTRYATLINDCIRGDATLFRSCRQRRSGLGSGRPDSQNLGQRLRSAVPELSRGQRRAACGRRFDRIRRPRSGGRCS